MLRIGVATEKSNIARYSDRANGSQYIDKWS